MLSELCLYLMLLHCTTWSVDTLVVAATMTHTHFTTMYVETSHTPWILGRSAFGYAGDGYVHCPMKNRSDGKLVELLSATDHADPAIDDYAP